MSKFTNTGLVDLARKALKENWGYVNGTFGNILTATLLQQKCTQTGGVGEYNTYWKDRYIKNFIGQRVSDCYGLVKAYVWWTNEGASPRYNSLMDRNQEGAYVSATEKGPLSTLPELPGVLLWMKGHVGIYIGNGEFIECAGCPVGMRKGTVKNGMVISGSKFTNWFKDNWITYIEEVDDMSKALVLQEDWHWTMLLENIKLYKSKGFITGDEWEKKVKDKSITVDELVWLNNEIISRIVEGTRV